MSNMVKYKPEDTDLFGAEGYVIRVYYFNKDEEEQIGSQAFIEKTDYIKFSNERLGHCVKKLVEGKNPNLI